MSIGARPAAALPGLRVPSATRIRPGGLMKLPFSLKQTGALLALPLLTFAAYADATNIFDPTVSGDGAINNSAIQLDATIFSFGPSASVWTIDVFAAPGECVRLDVTSQPADFELTVVAPNGTV